MKKISFGKISKDFGKSAESIEATGTIGTFGPPKAIETLADDHETQEMKTVMGISGFGKKAKTFDIQVSKLFEINISYLNVSNVGTVNLTFAKQMRTL